MRGPRRRRRRLGGARPRPWWPRHAARGVRSRRRRIRLARAGRRNGEGPDTRGDARRHCCRGSCALRADPERSARHRDRRRRRASHSAHGAGSPSERWPRLPRTCSSGRGAHAVADARLGRLRCSGRCLLGSLLRRRVPFAAVLRGARDGIRDADGPLALVRLLPTHVGGARHGVGAGDRLQHRACPRKLRARRSSPGPSCGVCSSVTDAASARRWCGHAGGVAVGLADRRASPAQRAAATGPRAGFGGVPRRPSERERGLCRAGARARRAADRMGGARPRRGGRLSRRSGRRRSRSSRARTTDVRTDADLALRVVALAALGETRSTRASSRGCAATQPGRARQRDDLDGARPARRRGAAAADARAGDPRRRRRRAAASRGRRGGKPDSNDTAAAIQALRAPGVAGAPIRRAVVALRAFQNRDGGFALTKGRESGRAVDRVGDPGAPQRRREARQASVPLSSRGSGGPTGATATRFATGRHRCGSRRRCCLRSPASLFRCTDSRAWAAPPPPRSVGDRPYARRVISTADLLDEYPDDALVCELGPPPVRRSDGVQRGRLDRALPRGQRPPQAAGDGAGRGPGAGRRRRRLAAGGAARRHGRRPCRRQRLGRCGRERLRTRRGGAPSPPARDQGARHRAHARAARRARGRSTCRSSSVGSRSTLERRSTSDDDGIVVLDAEL